MTIRLSAVIETGSGRLLAQRQSSPDGMHRHRLPGRVIDGQAEPGTLAEVFRRILGVRLGVPVTVGALVHVAKTGECDEYVFAAYAAGLDPEECTPALDGGVWVGIDLTPDEIHAARFMPKEIGLLIAGHLRHGRPPWALPDLRSRSPASRRHHKKRRGGQG